MERLFFASGSTLYEYAMEPQGQVEADLFMVVKSKAFAPMGLYGDAVFRRVSVTVTHEAGFALRVIPIVDGVEQPGAIFSLPSTPGVSVETVVLDVAVAKRGTTIQIRVESLPLNGKSWLGTVHVDNGQVLYREGHAGAGGDAEAGASRGARSVGGN